MVKRQIPLAEIDIGKVSYRFWTKTRQIDSCLEWTGGCDKDGYGKFSIFNTDYRAPRVAYFLYHGKDPGRMLVLHRCDNPSCVNPNHLFIGDQRINIRDMDTKGRRGIVDQKGERSGRAILTERDVIQIRKIGKLTREITRQLSTRYGVSQGCIDHAWRGVTWKHL